MGTDMLGIALNAATLALLGLAVYWDVKSRRIPNRVLVTAVALGLVLRVWQNGLAGAGAWFAGLVVGLALFIIPFALRGLGAADVKLMGAIGALQGWPLAVEAALLTALCGGVISLVVLVYRRQAAVVCRKVALNAWAFVNGSKVYLPFATLPGGEVINGCASGEAVGSADAPIAGGSLATEETPRAARDAFPYGVAIAIGTVTAWFVQLPVELWLEF